MKKIIVSLSVMLAAVNISYAGLVTLPGKDVLKSRLRAQGFDHFVEKTKIIDMLADQEKEVMGVIIAVELSLADYAEYLKQPMMVRMMEMLKPQLIKAILEGNDEAIKEASDLQKEIAEQSK